VKKVKYERVVFELPPKLKARLADLDQQRALLLEGFARGMGVDLENEVWTLQGGRLVRDSLPSQPAQNGNKP
jgi:hypothetical protein